VTPNPPDLATDLARLARGAHARGWALGTSGNFSAVAVDEPLRLLVTPSGVDKGSVQAQDLVTVDGDGVLVYGCWRPSAETSLHLAIVQARGARAVSHTHSVWGTLLSEAAAADGAVVLEGWEMLKGLAGVATHEHRERVPVIRNVQDWERERSRVETMLRDEPGAHAFLIRGHGLYTWGATVAELQRHVEVLEFLLEVAGRERGWRI